MTDLLVKVLGDGIEQRPGVVVDRRQIASLLTASAVRKLVARAGEHARITFPVHPHMLRHGCGFKLANDGHDIRVIQHYLGHGNIQHTVRYTELAADRFTGFWKD
jgi:type 1 fimbriae regulatory protein FimE